MTGRPQPHLPSGPRAAWLTCVTIAHNLLRPAVCLASLAHPRFRGVGYAAT
jgi:hypothetical protein